MNLRALRDEHEQDPLPLDLGGSNVHGHAGNRQFVDSPLEDVGIQPGSHERRRSGVPVRDPQDEDAPPCVGEAEHGVDHILDGVVEAAPILFEVKALRLHFMGAPARQDLVDGSLRLAESHHEGLRSLCLSL